MASTGSQQTAHPSRHPRDETSKKSLWHLIPTLAHRVFKLLKVLWRVAEIVNLPLHVAPHVFNKVHVGGSGWPSECPDPQLLLELLHTCSPMWCGVIILQDAVLCSSTMNG